MKSFFQKVIVFTMAAIMCVASIGCKNQYISDTTGRILLYGAISVAYTQAIKNGVQIGEDRVDIILDRIGRIKSVIEAVATDMPLPDIGIDPAPLLTVEVFSDKKAAKEFAIDLAISLAYQYAVERGAEVPKAKLQKTYLMLTELESAIMFATGRSGEVLDVMPSSVSANPIFDLIITD